MCMLDIGSRYLAQPLVVGICTVSEQLKYSRCCCDVSSVSRLQSVSVHCLT